MKKIDEINNSRSCLNKAHNEEMIFVLLGRDPAAVVALEAWKGERIRLGLNEPEDIQMENTRMCQLTMQQQQGWHKKYSYPPQLGDRTDLYSGAINHDTSMQSYCGPDLGDE